MKVQEVITKMKSENLIDDRELLVYATKKGILGGAAGAAMNLAILSVYKDTLYVHRAAMDNSYHEQLAAYQLSDLKIVKSKAGFFGGDFVFEYEGKKEHYSLPSKSEKFAEFFASK